MISKPPAGAGGLLITIPGGLRTPQKSTLRPPHFKDPGGPGPQWPGGQDLGVPGPRVDHLHLDSMGQAHQVCPRGLVPQGPGPLALEPGRPEADFSGVLGVIVISKPPAPLGVD